MKRSFAGSLALVLLYAWFSNADAFVFQGVKKPGQSGGVTGTYKFVLNSVEVVELPENKVRIRFAGFYPNDRKRVETRNSGGFDEIVPLEGKTANVKIQFGDNPCTIKLEFRPGKVIVEQGGSLMGCGFGFNVEPDGTYVKVSSKRPNLPPRQD